MSTLPQVRPDRLVRALQKAGSVLLRQSGSHAVLKTRSGKLLSVPVHGGRDVPPGTLRSILRDAKITADELRDLL